jgi:acylpyruvate hydrolase
MPWIAGADRVREFRNSLAGASDPIVLPDTHEAVGYEGEPRRDRTSMPQRRRGRCARPTSPGRWRSTTSARATADEDEPVVDGKAIDTFAPCVPTLVFMDGIDDVQAARVERRVNGETVQSGTTASMFFTMAEIIIFISSVMTFEPRDIGATRRRDFMRTPPCWSRRMTSSKSRSRRRPARNRASSAQS